MKQIFGKPLKEGIDLPVLTEVIFDPNGRTWCKVPVDCLIDKDKETIKVNDGLSIKEVKDRETHFKGYLFDSLVYRYKVAREKLAIYEDQHDKRPNKPDYFYAANRDLMRFIEILNEVIGEHD